MLQSAAPGSLPDLARAAVLGLVEGATEFIPVSSTGHLILASDALGLDPSEPRMVVFNVVIQLAAILAVVWVYRAKITDVIRRLPTDRAARRLAGSVILASIPAAVLGLLFDDWIDEHLFRIETVAAALVVGGVAILAVERMAERRRIRVLRVDDIEPPDAIKVGLAQCLALFPGVSRSASTILGGVAFGLSRVAATEFSFFLAIPIMLGASGLKLVKESDALSASDASFFAVGCAVAFVSALVVIRFLIRFVAQHTFSIFAWYRIAIGLAILGWVYL
ncbi:MAG TPA: undecaprenyl-diphosphate phosphatase [Rubricoccaceae bacterium]|jgi:undecaprenyl-diphosphatase